MKSIRLHPEVYRQGHIFSVTMRTAFSRPIFRAGDATRAAIASLRQAIDRFDARVYAYCFMPDHVHLLARTPPDVDFAAFVNGFKQRAGLAVRAALGDPSPVWQPRFYDHALRSTEGILPTMRYIFANPVRSGIVASPSQYPYSGSFEWPEVLSAGLESPGLHSSVVPER